MPLPYLPPRPAALRPDGTITARYGPPCAIRFPVPPPRETRTKTPAAERPAKRRKLPNGPTRRRSMSGKAKEKKKAPHAERKLRAAEKKLRAAEIFFRAAEFFFGGSEFFESPAPWSLAADWCFRAAATTPAGPFLLPGQRMPRPPIMAIYVNRIKLHTISLDINVIKVNRKEIIR